MLKYAVIAACSAALPAAAAFAALSGSATLNPTTIAGGTHYDAAVSNTGTTTIGTFWFAWIPGQFYLSAVPTTITSPAGWTGSVVGNASGSSIRWQASSAASYIPAGGNLSGFGFNSTNNPAFMSGNAVNFPSTPVTTSFFYIGAAFGDAGFRTVVSVVPTPTSAVALLLVPALAARRRRRPSIQA